MNFDFKLETGEIPEKEFDTIYKHIFKNCKDSQRFRSVPSGCTQF